MAQKAKKPSAIQKAQIQSLGWEDPLEKGMVTHSRILAMERRAWRLYSMGLQRVGRD